MPLFDREGRRETARIKELGDLLDQVRQPDFWDRLIQAQAGSADDDSLVRVIARRAEIRKVSPATLFGEYLRQIQASTYPTSDCLEAETFQAISASQAPTPEQAQHLDTCHFCRQLLDACKLRPEEQADIMAVVRNAVADERPSDVRASPRNWTDLLAAFRTLVQGQGLAFARRHPAIAPIVVVDDDNFVDPERWDQESSLSTLRELYREAEKALEAVHATPLCRVVVLKDDVSAYDDRDYAVIRRAISHPITRTMFLVPRRFATAFGGRSWTVVGDDAVFEMAPPGPASGAAESGAVMIRDAGRAANVRRVAEDLGRSAFSVYCSGELNPKLKWALDSASNDRLRHVLEEVAQTDVDVAIG